MALIVSDPRGPGLDRVQAYHLYCSNDAMGAREIFDILYPRLTIEQRKFYNATMAFLSPTLAMTLRGTRIDEGALVEALRLREGEELDAVERLRRYPRLLELWDEKEPWDNKRDGYCQDTGKSHTWSPRGAEPGAQTCGKCGVARLVTKPLNPHSSPQMARLLYDKLGMKRRYSRKTGEVTTDDEALEALAAKYPDNAELIDEILLAREARKQVAVLKSRRDADGRWRASFNVSGAETDRMSSSKSAYRTGSNMQNIAERSRNIFAADPGLIMFYADLEQAESRVVAADAECSQDMEDHASGDTHTGLAKNIFPHLPWGTAPDKDIAKTPLLWDPEHDHRHVAKIVRHGTNIGMTPWGIQRQLHCTLAEAKYYRAAYFERYPENLRRQQEVRAEVAATGALTNPLGRTRLFLGRPWDEQTMKEALAQTQQSAIAWVLNVAMWRIWHELDGRTNIWAPPRPSDPNCVWLLGQIHDAVLGLVRPNDTTTLRRLQEILETPIEIRGRQVVIPAEILIGKSWSKKDLTIWRPK